MYAKKCEPSSHGAPEDAARAVVSGGSVTRNGNLAALGKADVGGTGLPLGLTEKTLRQVALPGARYLTIQVSDSGRLFSAFAPHQAKAMLHRLPAK